MMSNCAACGAENYPGAFFCEACGAAIHPAAVAYLAALQRTDRPAVRVRAMDQSAATNAPAPPDAPPPAAVPRALRVRLPHHDAELIARGATIHVGRADPEAGFAPEMDLTAYGGQERGVSRRHATIEWIEGGYVLTDQNSSVTFLDSNVDRVLFAWHRISHIQLLPDVDIEKVLSFVRE
jgi:hypothetical protein